MIFRRKAYDRLLEWKEKYADHYSILLEGPRRVGKSTIAESFAKNEYDSYILIDFASASKTVMSCFDDLADIDMFFLRLQAVTGVQLVQHRSVIIFDEIQLYPPARQAIKYSDSIVFQLPLIGRTYLPLYSSGSVVKVVDFSI